MRHLILVLALLSANCIFAQMVSKWQIVNTFQPELTFHSKNYSFVRSPRPIDSGTKVSFSYGIGTALKYNVSDKWFLQGGINFVYRNMRGTRVMLNTREMTNDSILPLIVSPRISLRTLELPLAVGYNLIWKKKEIAFITAGESLNYLVNVKYTDRWTFPKRYWQGSSINIGAGYTRAINEKISYTGSATFSIRNTVVVDKYLGSQDHQYISVPHTFLKVHLGAMWNL